MRTQLTALLAVAVAIPVVSAFPEPAQAQSLAARNRDGIVSPQQYRNGLARVGWTAPLITNASRKACREREAAELAEQTGDEAERTDRRRKKSRCR